MILLAESSDTTAWLRDFGTGWKGLIVLLVVVLGWVARGVIPDCHKNHLEYKKFLKGHDERMAKLASRADNRRKGKTR